MFVNSCVHAENGIKQPQGIKMISDGKGVESVTWKMKT